MTVSSVCEEMYRFRTYRVHKLRMYIELIPNFRPIPAESVFKCVI